MTQPSRRLSKGMTIKLRIATNNEQNVAIELVPSIVGLMISVLALLESWARLLGNPV